MSSVTIEKMALRCNDVIDKGRKNTKMQIQWGSDFQICPAFKWLNAVLLPNGMDFKWS